MQGLPVGEMIKKSDLPLVDAMNSIELFAPKMDTGMAGPSSLSASETSKAVQEGRTKLFEPMHTFTPEEILWIMDEVLSAEVSPLPLAHWQTDSMVPRSESGTISIPMSILFPPR